MKVHYINILLFALPLNILAHNQRNHKKTILRTPKTELTKTHRTLCECELYAPSNYENNPEMKEVMEIFDRQTSERFREYDERIQDKRKQFKEQCEKDIQKIILKDKIEKELTEKFGALQTNITTEYIPTCVCKKSVADKTEKICLNCGKTMGAVAPAWGLVSGLGYAGWKIAALAAADKAGVDAGIQVVINTLKTSLNIEGVSAAEWKILITAENYANEMLLKGLIRHLGNTLCGENIKETGGPFCLFTMKSEANFSKAITTYTHIAVTKSTTEVVKITQEEVSKVTLASSTYSTAITASVVAIVVIVLVMVIIYLILRYRRKKKMKKKLQYIKLLEE